MTVHKPKEKFSASVSVIAVTNKETVRTPEDPDRSFGFATVRLGPRTFSGFNEVNRRSSPLPDCIFLTTGTYDCNFRRNV